MMWKENEGSYNFGVQFGTKVTDKYREKMQSILESCKEMNIAPPKEVSDFFNDNDGYLYTVQPCHDNEDWEHECLYETTEENFDEDGDDMEDDTPTLVIDVNKIPNNVDYIKVHIKLS